MGAVPDAEGTVAAGKQQQSPVRNKLLAALPAEDFSALQRHAESVDLPRGRVLYEPGEEIQYAYFPHTAVVSLVAVLEEGRTAEVALFGCEGVLGLAGSFVSRESFGRYLVQIPGTASRVPNRQIARSSRHQPCCTRPDAEVCRGAFHAGIPDRRLQRHAQCRSTLLQLDPEDP